MPKKSRITEKELATFYDAIEGTIQLVQEKIHLKPPAHDKPVIKKTIPSGESVHLKESASHKQVSGEEFLSFKQNSLPYKSLRNLRKGQYNVEAKLDLHGMTIEEAQKALEVFFQQCLNEGFRVVLIIHGKGHHRQGPILKNKLNQWFRDLHFVLAFCSALSSHGSRGALYVLLKTTERKRSFE